MASSSVAAGMAAGSGGLGDDDTDRSAVVPEADLSAGADVTEAGVGLSAAAVVTEAFRTLTRLGQSRPGPAPTGENDRRFRCAAGQVLDQPIAFVQSEDQATEYAMRMAFDRASKDDSQDGEDGADARPCAMCQICDNMAPMSDAKSPWSFGDFRPKHHQSCPRARLQRPVAEIDLGTWNFVGGKISGPATQNCRLCDKRAPGGLARNMRGDLCKQCRAAQDHLRQSPLERLRKQLRNNTMKRARHAAARQKEPPGISDRLVRVDHRYGWTLWKPKLECPETAKAAEIFGNLRKELSYQAPDNHDSLIEMLQRGDGAQFEKGPYSLSASSALAPDRGAGAADRAPSAGAGAAGRAPSAGAGCPQKAEIFYRNLNGTPAFGRENGINGKRNLTSIFWSVALAVKENRENFSIFAFGECLPDVKGLVLFCA